MVDKPNNGYATKISENPQKTNLSLTKYRITLYAGIGSAICLITCALDMAWLASIILPFFAVAGIHFWHAVILKGSQSSEMSHGLFCASIFGEILGGTAVSGFANRTIVHLLVLMLTGVLLGQEPTLIMYAGSRLFLWSCLPWFPEALRAVLSYASALGGLIAAKYVESVLTTKITSEIKFAAPRRRRTSNNTVYTVYKMRRTSLPALGGSNKSAHHAFGFQVSKDAFLVL